MPRSSNGNDEPQSITRMPSCCSIARQFMPISPSPPSGTTRIASGSSGSLIGSSLRSAMIAGLRECGGSLLAARGFGAKQAREIVAPIQRVSPEEAVALLDQGYVYVDVRSEPEFEAGHVPGAFNVPLKHATSLGAEMTPNDEFLDVMRAAFAKDDKLLLGCRSGRR